MSRSSRDKTSTIETSKDAESTSHLEGFELIINDDGTVTFIDFPPEMLDIAAALNPDDPLVCERKALWAQSKAEQSNGSDSGS
jgi:hypothetical protein